MLQPAQRVLRGRLRDDPGEPDVQDVLPDVQDVVPNVQQASRALFFPDMR